MLRFFEKYRKQQAIRTYMRRLRPRLIRRYGKKSHYTPKQVRATIIASFMPVNYECYAYAIYCSPEDFNQHHRETGEACDYGAMRSEVANLYEYSGSSDPTSIDFSDTYFVEANGGYSSGGDFSGDGGGSDGGGGDGGGGGGGD